MAATSTISGAIAATQVQFWAPKAGGGGVTLVMAFLNGNAVPGLLTPTTLAAKFVGVLCGCASGLAVGPEGPMVQIGACVASIVCSGQAGTFRVVRCWVRTRIMTEHTHHMQES